MFNKEKIIELINESGQYIDKFMLEAFIKNWKIEAIYEDENGVEFFDDDAVEKIKSGITPNKSSQLQVEHSEIETENHIDESFEEKTPAQEDAVEVAVDYEEINKRLDAINDKEPENVPVPFKNENLQKKYQENEIKNVTLDITNQTLGVLAEAIAGRITEDIAKYIKNTDFIQQAIDAGAFKKDNEILAKKVQELVNDNRIMAGKIQELEAKNGDYIKVFGNIYVKKN